MRANYGNNLHAIFRIFVLDTKLKMNNNPKKINKILIIRLGAIGDVVHTTNLYRALKKNYSNIKIHYLTSSLISPLLEEDPDLEKVLTIDSKFKLFSSYTKEFAKTLKNEKYDLVINLQPSLKVKALVFLAKIKKQIIYKKNFKEHAVSNFFSTGLKFFPNMKEEKNLKLYLPKTSTEKAKEMLKDLKRPIFVINAEGVMSKRQGRTYPIEKWIELGNKIQEKYNGTIILNGSKEDKEILSALNSIKNSKNYIGELSLADSCGIISQSDFIISGDSGPLHIATALDVRSIGLYGSMPVKRTGCFCNGVNIVSSKNCVPCNRRKCKFLKKTKKLYAPCMEEISVDSILNAITL